MFAVRGSQSPHTGRAAAKGVNCSAGTAERMSIAVPVRTALELA